MPIIQIAWGEEIQFLELAEKRLGEVLLPPLHYYLARAKAGALVQNALDRPAGAPPLAALAKGKRRIVILAGGAQCPSPAQLTLPAMLARLREGSPEGEIRILVATGDQGPMTREAILRRFGQTLLEQECVLCHDCDDEATLVEIGTLPSGGPLRINRLAAEADLLVAEGIVAPRVTTGFTGAAMGVFPGVAGRACIEAAFGAAGTGLSADIRSAARAAGLAFALNLALNPDKDPVFASAGGMDEAQQACVDLLETECAVEAGESDLVIAAAGGEPIDHTFWNSLETLSAAEPVMGEGGVSVLLARCGGGIGAETPWRRALLARLQRKTRIVFVSDLEEDALRALGITPAATPEAALAEADRLLGREERAAVIPDSSLLLVEKPAAE